MAMQKLRKPSASHAETKLVALLYSSAHRYWPLLSVDHYCSDVDPLRGGTADEHHYSTNVKKPSLRRCFKVAERSTGTDTFLGAGVNIMHVQEIRAESVSVRKVPYILLLFS